MTIDNFDISPEKWTAYFVFSGSLRIIKMAAAMRVTDSVNDDISSDCRMKILPAVVHIMVEVVKERNVNYDYFGQKF